jgi:hypothetical protein
VQDRKNFMDIQPDPNRQNFSQILAWLRLSQETVEMTPQTTRAEMSPLVEEQAKSETAKTRITNLSASARRQRSPQEKHACRICVALFGAITFSAGGQVLTARFGNFSTPAALLVGGTAGVLADDKATEVITHKRRQKSTKQVLTAIQEQQQANPPVNEFGKLFQEQQIALVLQVEGSNLEKLPILDTLLAAGLSVGEYVVSFSIVNGLGLPGGILLKVIVASLPPVMLWAGASIQSRCFEMPEHDRELIDQYEENISELTPEQQQKVILIEEDIEQAEDERKRKSALEERRQQFITENNPRLKNWEMVKADFEINWQRQKKHQFEQKSYETAQQIDLKFKADLKELPNKFQPPTGTYAPDQIKALKDQWVKEQAAKLEADRAQELEWLKYKCAHKIKQYDDKISAAQQQYNDAYQAWKKENNGS